ncbi:hypothetical protein [Mucilaginibacter sp. SP1R1]|nr:hypothetical protein [Mucilaginibacter sp. SP1R1]MBB6151618.1 hypothetical protein [Mucilaginibacter sp. SP1R1]MBB6151619.1 hypothetical protein [Mucilaginibacter sp. SP1R1]
MIIDSLPFDYGTDVNKVWLKPYVFSCNPLAEANGNDELGQLK